jgi:predicted ATPase/DNA-binding winged helix-turn-helix (wHTH) protein
MSYEPNRNKDAISFGAFRLFPAERLLEKAGVPVRLGSRALEILIALAEKAGEIVSKRDLIARVWPDVTVDESSLRVHVAALRKALGEGQNGARYVKNVTGRGYSFVAPIDNGPASPAVSVAVPDIANHAFRLPVRLSRMVGRDEAVRTIGAELAKQRFVTILGPGGIGKTTVAVAVAHEQLATFKDAVCFFDLGPISDPHLVPAALASMLGLLVQSDDATSSVVNFLRDRRLLLILDSCEHVVDAAATLGEQIFNQAPQVYILATSRESLRVEGEYIYRLPALENPPEGIELTAAKILDFPAAQLFVERAAASGYPFKLTDDDAPIVAEMLQKLDGIALAIELAASRVGAHGIQETAALLDDRFRLLWHGRRTAVLRHQTLSATLDWSYDLLPEVERTVLRRLSIFVGVFTLEAAQEVAADEKIDSAQVAEAVDRLIAKSLVSPNDGHAMMRYRLLDTARAYALGKLEDAGEIDATARRHAAYYVAFLERAAAVPSETSQPAVLAAQREHLGNIRAALEWSFSPHGDLALGTALAAASARTFLEMSLLKESHRWTERALAALDESTRGTRREMSLQSALGVSLMFTKGNSDQVLAAYTRALELAEELDDRLNQFRVLGRLHVFYERAGDFHSALAYAERCSAVANELGDPVGIGAAQSFLGICHHLTGDQARARTHLEAALLQPAASQLINTVHFGFHHHNRTRIALARTLWLQGHPEQAVCTARETVDEAIAIGHPVTICIALIWAVSVYVWTGEWTRAQQAIEQFITYADRYSLGPYHALGLGAKGVISVRRGDVVAGMALLRNSLETLHADRYELMTGAFNSALAEALASTGQLDQALTTIDLTVETVERNGDLFDMPELLRIKGDILVSLEKDGQAEECFFRSLALAKHQSALAWELRTASSLARVHLRSGRDKDARDSLAKIYGQFSEGFETADLKAARLLLN